MTLIKSISGIRGTVGGAQAENLTPPDVVKFTTAYARLIAERNPGKKLTIVVGRDARISGEMVSDLVEGPLLAWPSSPSGPTAASSSPRRTTRVSGTP